MLCVRPVFGFCQLIDGSIWLLYGILDSNNYFHRIVIGFIVTVVVCYSGSLYHQKLLYGSISLLPFSVLFGVRFFVVSGLYKLKSDIPGVLGPRTCFLEEMSTCSVNFIL